MTKQEFQATEGLLNDVMRKQAGSVEKAVLEAVMNSVDAGASTIEVIIEPGKMWITDDGEGMTEDEINEYFKKFGLKDDDIEEKEFGKFRMGRGQIFNFGKNIWHTNDNILVVSLDEDETVVEVGDETHTLDTSGLSYNVLDAEYSHGGCEIEVEFYNPLDNVEKTVDEIKKLVEFIPWLHNINLIINNEIIDSKATFNHATEEAHFLFEPDNVGDLPNYSNKTAIYNKGAFVKHESICPTGSIIVTEVDLDVNFARNDILDNDDNWDKIVEDFKEATEQYLIQKRGDMDKSERVWLLEQATGNDELYNQIKDIPIIETIEGESLSITDLQSEQISYTHQGDSAAKDLMESDDIVFLTKSYQGLLENIVEESQVLSYSDALSKYTFEMEEVDEEGLSKRRRERLAMARWFLSTVGYPREVEAGFSKHSNVWKDDSDTLYIHKGLLNEDKMEFLTNGLDEILQVAAMQGDTRQKRSYNHTFKKYYWRYSKKRAEAQKKLLQGNANYEKY